MSACIDTRKTALKRSKPFLTASPGITPCTVAFINNDEEERRRRHLDAHMRTNAMSPGVGLGLRQGVVGLSTLSNTQIAEHYTDCIKLSSENKINARNAFGLHLIDYMLEVLVERGELENFQVAGCTLDAGAKIYASRVDSIYTDAYKILGGIGKRDHSKAESPTPSVEKPRKENIDTTIEINVKAINLSKREFLCEIDPFFQHLSEDRQNEGLMLCDLVTREDYALVLDMHGNNDTKAPHNDVSEHYNVHEILKGITNTMNSREICSPFLSFTVTEDSCKNSIADSEMLHYPSENDFTDQQPDYSMLPYPTTLPDSDSEETTFSHAPTTETLDNDQVIDLPNDSTLGVCGNKNIAHIIGMQPQEKKSSGAEYGDLLVTSTLLRSDYSYFDHLSTWAGLQHWKLRSGQYKEGKGKKAIHVPSERRVALKISFHDNIMEKSFQGYTKNSTIDVPLISTTSLPEDVHLKMNNLLGLFMHSKWKVEKQKMMVTTEAELSESCFGYEEDHDNDVASSSSLNVSDTTFGQTLPVEDTNMSHFTLVLEPRKVQTVSIEYSKRAKKIDAKRLKETMWKAITSMPNGEMDLSSLCGSISENFSPSSRDDITTSICFVFLLHLANEKGLSLFDKKDLSDVVITSCG